MCFSGTKMICIPHAARIGRDRVSMWHMSPCFFCSWGTQPPAFFHHHEEDKSVYRCYIKTLFSEITQRVCLVLFLYGGWVQLRPLFHFSSCPNLFISLPVCLASGHSVSRFIPPLCGSKVAVSHWTPLDVHGPSMEKRSFQLRNLFQTKSCEK